MKAPSTSVCVWVDTRPRLGGKVRPQDLSLKALLVASIIEVRIRDICGAEEPFCAVIIDVELSVAVTRAEGVVAGLAVGLGAAGALHGTARAQVQVVAAVPGPRLKVNHHYFALMSTKKSNIFFQIAQKHFYRIGT